MSNSIPYGAWESPISAADVAAGNVLRTFPSLLGEATWWTELRPHEGGRLTVMRREPGGDVREVLPPPWNARTRVHEYGGRAAIPVATADGVALVFTNFADQRVWRLDVDRPGAEPVALTPERPDAAARYADPVLHPDGRQLWWVRELHESGQVTRHIVALPLDGTGAERVVAGGSDFLAYPRVSPAGRRLAWVAWDHPQMPWDGTTLRVADLHPDGTAGPPRVLLGGPTESVLQPEWADEETLYAITDRSGWWNLVRVPVDGGEPVALHPAEEEFAGPLWSLGATTYAPLTDGRLAVLHGTSERRLGVLDPATGALTDIATGWAYIQGSVRGQDSEVVVVAGSPTVAESVFRVDCASGRVSEVASSPAEVDPAYLPEPRAEVFAGPRGRDVHAIVYPPRHPTAMAPAGELAPYLVFVHGGPTAQSFPSLSPEKAFFTSRGIGVLDVNYGGSSGYGRAYRERLREQWGVVDVEDVVAAARGLAERGAADGRRLLIRGGSAGGWTVLAALTRSDVFAAGASYYGVAELLRFAADTHDFESRYLDGLIGPLPEQHDRYVERAPLSHVDELSCPVLLLQGDEDAVVPPSQSELFRDALVGKGIAHAYLLFAGEQHGFRKAESVVAALEAELSFYGQVLGFDPPGVPRLELVSAPTHPDSRPLPSPPLRRS